MISKTGNSAHDANVLAAELVRQNSVAAGVASQSAMTAIDVTNYRSLIASAKQNGLPYVNFQTALWSMGVHP